MFMANRQTAIAFIDALGKSRCGYGPLTWPDGTCDCKSGWRPHQPHSTEQTGCPELRSIREALDALTDEEWTQLATREGNTPGMHDSEELSLIVDGALAAARRGKVPGVPQLERASELARQA